MASTALLYKINPTKIGVVTVDVVTKAEHSDEVDATEHPVERGSNVTDHARPKPAQLTLDCVVSDTPLSRAQARREVLLPDGSSFTSESEVEEQAGRADEAYQKLLAIKDAGTLVTVNTRRRTYENMLIVKLGVPEDAGTGHALKFTIDLRELRIVQSKVSRVVVTKEPRGQGRKGLGKQVPSAKGAAESKHKSLLLQGGEGLGEGFAQAAQSLGFGSP